MVTAVTRQPEQGKSWSCDFPVGEAITLFTEKLTVLQLTTAIP
jgi:hypothetical protein